MDSLDRLGPREADDRAQVLTGSTDREAFVRGWTRKMVQYCKEKGITLEMDGTTRGG